MTRRTSFHLAAAFSVAAAAVGLAVAVVGAKPAQALPTYKSTCTGCHYATPSGTVTATPSKPSLSPGEAYSVQVAVGLTACGQAGYWISSNDASDSRSEHHRWSRHLAALRQHDGPLRRRHLHVQGLGRQGKPGSGRRPPPPTRSPSAAAPCGRRVVDTVAPTTKAPSAAKNVRGKKATLKYQVNDAAPNLGKATAVIKIKNKAGKVVKTIKPGAKTVNVLQKATFTCKLAKGTYKFYVTATDAAGNKASNTAVNKLTVK